MLITIEESVTRQCCQEQDLRIYRGLVKSSSGESISELTERLDSSLIRFCVYCGQVYIGRHPDRKILQVLAGPTTQK